MLLCVCFVGGQDRIISEAEFMGYRNQASRALANTPYREKMTTETKEVNDTVWRPFSISEVEYIRPDRMYSRSTTTGVGETEPSTEWIRVGDKKYVKYKGRGWQSDDRSERPTPPPAAKAAEKSIIEYKHLGTTIFLGQTAVLIQKTHIRENVVNGQTFLITTTERNWIDSGGRFLQLEFLTHNPPKRSIRQTTVYQYDPTIRIEAPIK